MYKTADYYGDKLAEIWYPIDMIFDGKTFKEWIQNFRDCVTNYENHKEELAQTEGVFNTTIKRWFKDKNAIIKGLKEFSEEIKKEPPVFVYYGETNQRWKTQIKQGLTRYRGMEKFDPDYEKISAVVRTFYGQLIGKKLDKDFNKDDSEENIAKDKEIDELLEKVNKINEQ